MLSMWSQAINNYTKHMFINYYSSIYECAFCMCVSFACICWQSLCLPEREIPPCGCLTLGKQMAGMSACAHWHKNNVDMWESMMKLSLVYICSSFILLFSCFFDALYRCWRLTWFTTYIHLYTYTYFYLLPFQFITSFSAIRFVICWFSFLFVLFRACADIKIR